MPQTTKSFADTSHNSPSRYSDRCNSVKSVFSSLCFDTPRLASMAPSAALATASRAQTRTQLSLLLSAHLWLSLPLWCMLQTLVKNNPVSPCLTPPMLNTFQYFISHRGIDTNSKKGYIKGYKIQTQKRDILRFFLLSSHLHMKRKSLREREREIFPPTGT